MIFLCCIRNAPVRREERTRLHALPKPQQTSTLAALLPLSSSQIVSFPDLSPSHLVSAPWNCLVLPLVSTLVHAARLSTTAARLASSMSQCRQKGLLLPSIYDSIFLFTSISLARVAPRRPCRLTSSASRCRQEIRLAD